MNINLRTLDQQQVRLEQVRYFGGRLKPIIWVLRVEPGDDVAQPFRDLVIRHVNWRRLFVDDLLDDGHQVVAAEGGLSGTHRVEDAAQAEQVAAGIETASPWLARATCTAACRTPSLRR